MLCENDCNKMAKQQRGLGSFKNLFFAFFKKKNILFFFLNAQAGTRVITMSFILQENCMEIV